VLVIAAPGQGAQTPGFLAPWLELPGFAGRLDAWSDLAGCDLIRYGTTAGAEEITDTAVAQPLLVAAALAAAEALGGAVGPGPGERGVVGPGPAERGVVGPELAERGAVGPGPALGGAVGPGPALGGAVGPGPAEPGDGGLRSLRRLAGIAAGHSVGELAAGAIAGAIGPADAMRLVGVRGRAMAKAAAAEATGMTAVLGGAEQDVLAALGAHGLTPANVNGAGQIVAAGTAAQLAALAASPPAGARLRPLAVAGAFHTGHMAPAVAALREAAAEVTVADPTILLLSNADGAAVSSGRDWLERIVTQVSAPVRWDECMRAMAGLGATALVELPPGGTLAGLARRALPGVALAALKSPGDLDAARALLAEHATPQPPGDGHIPEWRLLVSPLAGTFRAGPARHPGAHIAAGELLGHVEARSGPRPVSPGFAAIVLEWLVEDGDPVDTGQPLVRLQPEAA
jgi:[acyl-carrier-protein] S-malonyltransferase